MAAALAPAPCARPHSAAYYEDVIVGSVCCRVDTDAETSERKLYIMTLGCLAPYRRMGVGKCPFPCNTHAPTYL